jgi:dipeptidyl aminopeptidase/acylaminoacyl peptidase/uncharacterized GH25 family protein
MVARRLAVLLALVLTGVVAEGHDLWLIPDFSARPGQTIKIMVNAGNRFPAPSLVTSPDQFVRFDVQGPGTKLSISNARGYDKWTEAETALKEPGAYIIALEIKARPVRLDAKEFNEYLKREGLDQVVDARTKAKKDNLEGKELSASFAKSILRLGDKSDPGATRPVGLKLEVVPQVDPAQVRPGEKLPVLVLFDGKPLGGAQVVSVSDYFPIDDEETHSFATRTSLQGIAMIPIMNPGNWMVRLVHMIPSQGGDNDWESFSSSLTFRMPPERGFPLTIDSIMRGSDLVGYGINPIRWSGDGSRFYFNWRKPGEKDFHKYEVTRDGSSPRRLSKDEAKLIAPPGAQSTKDYRLLVFAEGGDLILQDAVTNNRTYLVRTVDPETAPRFTRDEKHVTFVRENNLYRISLDRSELVQLTDIRSAAPQRPESKPSDSQKYLEAEQKDLFEVIRERMNQKEEADARAKEKEKRKPYNLPQRASISGFQLSPDETIALFVQTERPEQAKSTIVPSFVTESGYTQDINGRTKVGDVQARSRLGLMSVETGEVVWIDHGQKDREVNLAGASWSEDGKNLVVVGTAADFKDRWIFLVDTKSGKTKVLDALHDDAWVMSGGFGGGFGASPVGWLPDGKSIYFVSEKDGFFQLYTADLDSSPAKPLTSGRFEVFGPTLSEDKSKFYFTSSEVHPGERHFYSMPLSGGTRTQITTMTGSNQAYLSPDEKTAAVIYSCSNKPPELYLMDNTPGAKGRQITVTPTEEWRSFPWVDPKVITFKARDGAVVYARYYTPEMLSGAPGSSGAATAPVKGRVGTGRKETAPAIRRPGVIFVHGAGYAQNAHKYWSSYFHEYMFHHILMDRGYVVMDIDYRASSGYGRDWRTAIYRHMGGKDLDDQVDGARWMAENLNVDPHRIGIYGGSYGGFITLMAMFTTPDVFAAGAALRPVTDWAHYNHSYTASILNAPQLDAEAYRQSSPIYFAEGLKGALLICHGMVDTNVHFQDTARLIERLIELRKENWAAAVFPVEDHGFQRNDSWADEYKRILALFETQLKKQAY